MPWRRLNPRSRCDNQHLRILHAIHDFLPRHQAGSEIYALELCRALSASHHVTVLCASYDPSRSHGEVVWRAYQGIPVIEIVNNWACRTFADTYRAPLIADRIREVLRAVQPDVVHIHNLLNLSFDLPALAHAQGIPVAATLHDYTLVCPSGGQRIHQAEQYVCHDIDTERCVRCFRDSPFFSQASFASIGGTRAPRAWREAAVSLSRRLPGLTSGFARAARHARVLPMTREDIDQRLDAARQVFDAIDLFAAPSPSIADEFRRLGVNHSKIRVSDYGFVPLVRRPRHGEAESQKSGHRIRLGFVGTLVWHKGVHVLLDAVRALPDTAYELKIFGSTDVFPPYTADLRARAAGLPVQFMGAFSRDQTADVYAQLDVLVVPSLWLENSPLVIHEAFMAGIPVVAACMGGIRDLVDQGRSGLLYDASSPAELAAALRRLIEHPELLHTLTEGARTIPRIKSIADEARDWDAAYADLLRPTLATADTA